MACYKSEGAEVQEPKSTAQPAANWGATLQGSFR